MFDIDGMIVYTFLEYFGRCGLEWACSVSRILQSLYSSPEWKAVIQHYLNDCVQMLTSEPDLPSIFALFVMAGFPEVRYYIIWFIHLINLIEEHFDIL